MLSSGSRGRAAQYLAALGVQTLATAIVFWPLPLRMTTAIAGGGFNWIIDVPLLLFVMTWESRALVADPAHLFDAPMYVPAAHAALYGPTGMAMLPLFTPVALGTGNPTLALNVALLASLTLTAWTTHLVVHRWTRSHGAGTVAGAAFLTTDWISRGWVPSAPSYAALMWFPLIIERSGRPITTVSAWSSLALLAWLQCLTDPIYVAPAVLGPLAAIGVVRTCRAATRRQGLALLGAVCAAGIAMLPLASMHASIRAANPDLAHQTAWAIRLPQGFPAGLLLGPTSMVPAVWMLVVLGATTALVRRLTRGPGFADRRWLALLPWWVLGVAISIGPAFFWFDTVVYNWPTAWLYRLVPLLDALRAPDRLRVATLMATALAAGLAFAECVRPLEMTARRRGWPARAVPAASLGVVLVAIGVCTPRLLDHPLQSFAPSPPALLEALARHAGPVVEVPAPPERGIFQAQAMLRAVEHRRPILNGYSGYWPAGFPERMALAAALPDREAFGALRAQTGVETIVIRRDRISGDALAQWRRELADPDSPFRLAWENPTFLVVDVAATRSGHP